MSVSKRIGRDRGVANFFAFIASLPALAMVGALVYLGYSAVTEDGGDLSQYNGYVVLALLASFARTSAAERWAKKGADSLAAIRSFCCYVFVPASRRYEYSEKEFEVSSSFDRESIDELTSWTPSPAVAAAPFCKSLYNAD